MAVKIVSRCCFSFQSTVLYNVSLSQVWFLSIRILLHSGQVLAAFYANKLQYRRSCFVTENNKLCGRPPQYAPAPCKLTFDLERGVRVTCDVGYLCANFSFPRPLCSRLRSDVCHRQTSDVRHASSLNGPYPRGGV